MFGKASSTYWYRYTIEVMWWQCYGPLSELSLIRVIQQFLPSSFTLTELHTSLCNLSKDQAFILTVHCNLPVFFSVHGVSTNSYRSWLTYVQSMDSQQFYYEFVLMTMAVQACTSAHTAVIFRCTYAWSNLQLMSTFFMHEMPSTNAVVIQISVTLFSLCFLICICLGT